VILNAMSRYGGLTNLDMASKWICLGCDDDSIFQDIQFWVITQTKEQIAPFLIESKVAFKKSTTTLCVELFHNFFDVEIMSTLGIVYL
jgi:hypothetical protein